MLTGILWTLEVRIIAFLFEIHIGKSLAVDE
jgi:hypothetical protein